MSVSRTLLDFSSYINAGFMMISFVIIGVFISRLDRSIPKTKPNILGLILMALGLSFHIMGVLILENVINTTFFENGFNHILFSFISLSVTMFIIGSALIAYHITSEDNKRYMKIFIIFYGFMGLVNILFHLSFFVLSETWTGQAFSTSPRRIDFYYILFEALSLVFIYLIIFLQSRKSVRKAVAERFRLLSLTSLGFVLVIVVDASVSLGIVTPSGIIVFSILFWLHVLTVGSLYLLVFFPVRYQTFRGIPTMTTA